MSKGIFRGMDIDGEWNIGCYNIKDKKHCIENPIGKSALYRVVRPETVCLSTGVTEDIPLCDQEGNEETGEQRVDNQS